MALESDLGWRKRQAPKKANSNKKGSRNELELAAFFTTWIGKPFGKNPMSGANANLRKLGLVADIICLDSNYNFPFSIETKFWQRFNIHKEEITRSKTIFKIWEHLVLECSESKKEPLLALRDNKTKGKWLFIFKQPLKIKSDVIIRDGKKTIYGYWSDNIIKHNFTKFKKIISWI